MVLALAAFFCMRADAIEVLEFILYIFRDKLWLPNYVRLNKLKAFHATRKRRLARSGSVFFQNSDGFLVFHMRCKCKAGQIGRRLHRWLHWLFSSFQRCGRI